MVITDVLHDSVLLQRVFVKNEPPDFSPMTYNGGGQEIDLTLGHRYRKIRPIGCNFLWAQYILQLSKCSVILSDSNAVSKLQEGDVRSSHSH